MTGILHSKWVEENLHPETCTLSPAGTWDKNTLECTLQWGTFNPELVSPLSSAGPAHGIGEILSVLQAGPFRQTWRCWGSQVGEAWSQNEESTGWTVLISPARGELGSWLQISTSHINRTWPTPKDKGMRHLKEAYELLKDRAWIRSSPHPVVVYNLPWGKEGKGK